MDELFGAIANTIARKLREANLTVAEAQRAQAEARQRASLPAPGVNTPEQASPRRTSSAGSRARQAATEISELETLFAAQAPVRANPAPQRSALLAAFGGGEPMLAAIILSEALALPVALRPPRW